MKSLGLNRRDVDIYTVPTTDEIMDDYRNVKRILIEPMVRKLLIEKAQSVCQRCINHYPYPEIHHIDGNRGNDDIFNLMVVCPNCHKILDMATHPTKEEEYL
jgi:predicted restriction endonuclease